MTFAVRCFEFLVPTPAVGGALVSAALEDQYANRSNGTGRSVFESTGIERLLFAADENQTTVISETRRFVQTRIAASARSELPNIAEFLGSFLGANPASRAQSRLSAVEAVDSLRLELAANLRLALGDEWSYDSWTMIFLIWNGAVTFEEISSLSAEKFFAPGTGRFSGIGWIPIGDVCVYRAYDIHHSQLRHAISFDYLGLIEALGASIAGGASLDSASLPHTIDSDITFDQLFRPTSSDEPTDSRSFLDDKTLLSIAWIAAAAIERDRRSHTAPKERALWPTHPSSPQVSLSTAMCFFFDRGFSPDPEVAEVDSRLWALASTETASAKRKLTDWLRGTEEIWT